MVTVTWVGSPNFSSGRQDHQPIALVIHTMAGSLSGTDGWFNNPQNQDSSAHYGVSLSGVVHQYVNLADRAWANGVLEPGNRWPGPVGVNPNALTVSIETEDLGMGSTPVTEAQYQSVLGIGRAVLAQYPSIRLLVAHAVISPHSRSQCPGPRWTSSGRFQTLADALGLQALT